MDWLDYRHRNNCISMYYSIVRSVCWNKADFLFSKLTIGQKCSSMIWAILPSFHCWDATYMQSIDSCRSSRHNKHISMMSANYNFIIFIYLVFFFFKLSIDRNLTNFCRRHPTPIRPFLVRLRPPVTVWMSAVVYSSHMHKHWICWLVLCGIYSVRSVERKSK